MEDKDFHKLSKTHIVPARMMDLSSTAKETGKE